MVCRTSTVLVEEFYLTSAKIEVCRHLLLLSSSGPLIIRRLSGSVYCVLFSACVPVPSTYRVDLAIRNSQLETQRWIWPVSRLASRLASCPRKKLAGCAENLQNKSLLQKLYFSFVRNWLGGCWLHQCVRGNSLAESKNVVSNPRITLYSTVHLYIHFVCTLCVRVCVCICVWCAYACARHLAGAHHCGGFAGAGGICRFMAAAISRMHSLVAHPLCCAYLSAAHISSSL